MNREDGIVPIYEGSSLARELGYCTKGSFKGWIMARHPDGQWVSLGKVPEISLENIEPKIQSTPSNNKQRLEIVNLDRWDGQLSTLIYWVNQCRDKVNEVVYNFNHLP